MMRFQDKHVKKETGEFGGLTDPMAAAAIFCRLSQMPLAFDIMFDNP